MSQQDNTLILNNLLNQLLYNFTCKLAVSDGIEAVTNGQHFEGSRIGITPDHKYFRIMLRVRPLDQKFCVVYDLDKYPQDILDLISILEEVVRADEDAIAALKINGITIDVSPDSLTMRLRELLKKFKP